jgi:dipeptidyl aminopeptidase/acylaminoacyl peptidase
MKRTIILSIVIFFFSITYFAQSKHAITVNDLWAMKRIENIALSPNGKLIAFSVTTYSMKTNKGNTDIWLVNSDGTDLRPFKTSKKSESDPAFSPDGKEIYYNLNGQIRKSNIDGSHDVPVTHLYSSVSEFTLSKKGLKLLFVSEVFPNCKTQKCDKEKDAAIKNNPVKARIITHLMFRIWNRWRGEKRSHLFVMNLKTGNYTDLTQGKEFDVPPLDLGSTHDFTFSPDGKEIAYVANKSKVVATNTNNDVFLIELKNVKNGKPAPDKKISVSKGNDNQPVYSPNGKYIAFRSMKQPGFESDKYNLVLYNRKTGKLKIIPNSLDVSIGQMVWSKNSKYIYYTAAYQIYNSIFKIDINTGKSTPVLIKRVNSSIILSPNGKKLFFRQERSTLPYEIFNINTNGKNLKQLTFLNKSRLNKLEMNEIETFWSKGAGGTKIQSILVKPPFFDAAKKYPLLFLIHGGPQGHWTDEFHYRWNLQLFASKGYVIVAPNPRGSVGYGQQFTNEVSKDWGGKPYIDLMNAYDYAIKNFSFIDTSNTFAAGASYGGYMIDWIEGHTNRFKALVSHDGVFDLVSMYGSTEELWFPEWEFDGPPWKNRKLYEKWSPSSYVQNFKTPMLIIQGAKDYRVPDTQAFELFTSLQRMGVESKLLYFQDEFHFVIKPLDAKLWWNTIFNWLEQHYTRH